MCVFVCRGGKLVPVGCLWSGAWGESWRLTTEQGMYLLYAGCQLSKGRSVFRSRRNSPVRIRQSKQDISNPLTSKTNICTLIQKLVEGISLDSLVDGCVLASALSPGP